MISNLGHKNLQAASPNSAGANVRAAEERLLKADINDSRQKAQIVMGRLNYRSQDEEKSEEPSFPLERVELSKTGEQEPDLARGVQSTEPAADKTKAEPAASSGPSAKPSATSMGPAVHKSPAEQVALMKERQSQMQEVHSIFAEMEAENKKTRAEIQALIMQTNQEILEIFRNLWLARVKSSEQHMKNVQYLITESWPMS